MWLQQPQHLLALQRHLIQLKADLQHDQLHQLNRDHDGEQYYQIRRKTERMVLRCVLCNLNDLQIECWL